MGSKYLFFYLIDPAGVFGGFSAPVWRHEQSTGDSEGDDAHDDEE